MSYSFAGTTQTQTQTQALTRIGTASLMTRTPQNALFYRFIRSETNFCYNDKMLSMETHVITENNAIYVDINFSVVVCFIFISSC